MRPRAIDTLPDPPAISTIIYGPRRPGRSTRGGDLAQNPGFGELHLAVQGGRGEIHHFGSLIIGEAAEEKQFDRVLKVGVAKLEDLISNVLVKDPCRIEFYLYHFKLDGNPNVDIANRTFAITSPLLASKEFISATTTETRQNLLEIVSILDATI